MMWKNVSIRQEIRIIDKRQVLKMNKKVFIVIIGVLAFLGFIGCSGKEQPKKSLSSSAPVQKFDTSNPEAVGNKPTKSSNLEPQNTKTINAKDYIPLELGLSWEYTDGFGGLSLIEEITDVDSSNTVYQMFRTIYIQGNENFKLNDIIKVEPNGDIYRISQNVLDSTYNKAQLLLKNGAKIGDSWEYNNTGEISTYKVIGFGEVNTSAGKFNNCLVVEESVVGYPIVSKFYYAPNVGLVKVIAKEEGKQEVIIQELKVLYEI